MAKTDGSQSVPSALLDKYRATLGQENPDDVVQKRYPYRVPTMQNQKGTPSAAQKEQRAKFKNKVNNFNNLSQTEKERWFAGAAAWRPGTWYYDFFIQSGLADIILPDGRPFQMLSNIQHTRINVPTGGTTFTLAQTVVPTKCVVMLYGASYKDEIDSPNGWAYAYPCYPNFGNFLETSINIGFARTPDFAADITVTILEYL